MDMGDLEQDENVKNKLAMSRLSSQLRNMAQSSPTSPSISSSSEDSDDLSEDDGDNTGIDYLIPGQKKGLASTCRLLLSEEESLNRDFSSLTLVAPETQARLEALLEVAGVAADGRALTDPDVVSRLTSSVSSALDEAAAALTRMRSQAGFSGPNHIHDQGTRSLVEACIEGDIAAVRKLLDEGRSVHEPTDEGESLLSLACSAGYYELVQVLLAMKANVEDRGSKGDCTPLMEAASGGFVDIVRLLLQHNADINAQSSSGNTALHYACCGGYEDVVGVLLEHSADLEHQNENGHTPLMEAASGGRIGVAKLLLDKGAGINTHSSEFKESALTLASYKGHVDMVRFLLERGADQEHKTDEMHTALMEASMDGHVEVAKLLLEHGAQVNMPADSFESPLTLAACGSHVDLAHLLIEHGANLEEVNDEGYTPLMEAAREGYLPMVALLLEHGCNINAQTEETQETALTLACCGGFKEVVAFLLEAGADIELGASSPLMEAATEGHVDLVKFLLEKGAKVDAKTATGDTGLTYACENGHTNVAEVLLGLGAELEHESEGGRTPLMKAARAGHKDTVDFLIRKGANVNRVTSSKDHSVLSLSCAGGHTDVVQLLLAYGADPCQKLKDNSSMLIEASKGGHTAVALLLMETPLHMGLIESPVNTGFNTPVGSPNGTTPILSVQQQQHQQQQQQQQQQRNTQFHSCGHECQHLPPVQDYFGHTCNLGSSCEMMSPPPSVVQPNSIAGHPFAGMPSSFNNAQGVNIGAESVQAAISASAVPTSEFIVPNLPMSISPSTPLASLTQADLQSLAQALSFSASVNPLTNVISTSATVAENLGISSAVNFPPIDPNVASMLSSTELSIGFSQIPPPVTSQDAAAAAATVDSDARTVTSTGIQTEDAISMIHRLTDSVQQLSALQNFAASHNLEFVNLTPSLFPENADEGIMVAEPARPLQDTLAQMTRQDPVGECSPAINIPQASTVAHSRVSPPLPPSVFLNQQTESNHDTALTIACAGGHDDLVQLLLTKGSDVEHREKKGCTPLILAATAGHTSTCRILLDHECDIEAQSDRTKDTALSLACSSGRQEVVDLLLERGANYEHRNVSDYTPLSLAASGGYVNIIKDLLRHGAEINSRTGSKLGISPLMLAAMNGHVAAVKLLLDMGSDVNAQIETNRNTALTLACFQGRQEVVALLLDRKANVEHRAKTGLTPLMEAASGGYVEVGQVLIDRGADVNAPPVPSSRDTALTIATDKGHFKFVELLLNKRSSVDVKNKKGCSPLWLAANGGHLDVLQLLAKHHADLDSQDNRGISCLMAAFRKGHVKVVKWLVKHAKQFPADPDCKRFMQTITDKDMLKKLQECMEIIISAKDRQAAEANKYASILLEEIDHEKEKEERRKAALAKKRDKKKLKKKKKAGQDEFNVDSGDAAKENDVTEQAETFGAAENTVVVTTIAVEQLEEKEMIVVDEEKPMKVDSKAKNTFKKDKRLRLKSKNVTNENGKNSANSELSDLNSVVITSAVAAVASMRPLDAVSATTVAEITKAVATSIISGAKTSKSRDSLAISSEVAATMAAAAAQCAIMSLSTAGNSEKLGTNATSPKKNKRMEDGWKEVTRRSKKIQIPAALISRVIGRGGCNVNAIRESTSAHIDIDTNRKKPNGDCMVTIKGSQLATRQAYNYIDALIKDPERDVSEILPARAKRLEASPPSPHSVAKQASPSSPSHAVTAKISPVHPNQIKTITTNTTTVQQHAQKHHGVPISQATSSQGFRTVQARSTAQATHRLPPRMGGPSSVPAASTVVTKTEVINWASHPSPVNSLLQQPNKAVSAGPGPVNVSPTAGAGDSPRSAASGRPPVARQLIMPSTAAAKLLPKPIGSNRPAARAVSSSSKDVTQTIQSTKTTPSASVNHVSTAHVSSAHGGGGGTGISQSSSLLNSFFSQVATQVRSPMIWNEPDMPHHEVSSTMETLVTTTTVSQNAVTVTIKTEAYKVTHSTVGLVTSTTFTKANSPSPTASPSPSDSASPSPGSTGDEKPHLNPIGTERAYKRSTSQPVPNVQVMAPFQSASDSDTQSVWGFGFQGSTSSTSGWSVPPTKPSTNWSNANHVNAIGSKSSPTADLEDDFVEIASTDNLKTVLERLALSNYLCNFQENEIDLEALLLMSEQDYADIGLPKNPRVKLMKSTQRFFTRNKNNSNNKPKGIPNHTGAPQQQQQQQQSMSSNSVDMSHAPSPSLWNASTVMSNGMIQVGPSKGMIPPSMSQSNVVDFNVSRAQMMQAPPWRPWSRTDQ